MKTLLICSGGLDSVTLAYQLANKNHLVGLLAFDYGQRHITELDYAKQCARSLNVPIDVINLKDVGNAMKGSALTGQVDVPDGHYAADTMQVTIVPNRNAIMLSIAFGLAASADLDAVAIAVHGGDHFIYPDCRADFIDSFSAMQNHALDGVAQIKLITPYLDLNKSDIVKIGAQLNLPYENTWSCYKGGRTHCGRCGTCVERCEAFATAEVVDPTHYLDANFWRTAIDSHQLD